MGSPGAPAPGKTLAPAGTPSQIQQGLINQGMDQGGNFTPGRPLQPYFGYSTPARATDFPVGVNIATQGRAAWNRPSFDVLKAIIDAYDVARMCINHKIDELRSMPLMFQPADGVKDDVDDAIEAAKLVLSYPDRELPYEAWLGKWLENVWKYDNAPLYKRRDYDGNVIGLEVVDGKTVHPYIDGNGRRPEPPAPMAWQVVHGMVGTWFTRDDLIYVPFRPQEDSPYGLAPIESILLTANTDIRFQWHFLQLFTDGSVPAGFMELPPDVSRPEQVREWQDHWDAMVMGDQAKLHQLLAVPNGSKFTATKPATFDEKFPQYLMRRCCAAHGLVPQDLGFVEDVNRANGETQTDIQFRVNTLPSVLFVNGILTRYLQRDIGLPVKVSLDTGRDKEDRLQEAQAHDIYVKMGAESVDEVRVDVLGKPVDKERPTPRFLFAPRIGAIPLLAIEGVAGRTDQDTFGPAKDQKALDQPFVPPIGIVPMPGTTDDKATQAAVDAYQVATRRQLDSQQDPNRESEADREARGAKQTPGTGDAPLTSVPQGSQAQQQATGTVPAQEGDTVAKAADLTGAEADELSAFRTYVTGCKRRGRWARDFAFTAVSPHIGAELNRGARAEVTALLKAKAQDAAQGNAVDANEVYQQLAENFPAAAIKWVLDEHWIREDVPLDRIDWSNMASWHAARQPEQVAKLARKMGKGKAGKPAILIDRPGKPTMMLADGHHHALARRSRHEPVPAYVAHVAKATGPWDEMHARQHGDANYDAPVAKADGDPKDQAPAQGPDSAQQWPGWQYDLAAAAYWTSLIAAALGAAIDADALVHAFLASHTRSAAPDGESEAEREQRLRQAAEAWVQQYSGALQNELRTVVPGILADGYAIGAASAAALMDAGEAGRALDDLAADMAGWHPGNYEAAMLLIGRDADGSGLRDLLDQAQVTIKSIAQSRLDDLGFRLAVGAARGDSADTIAGDIRDLLTAPWRAEMVASTELSRAVSAAAVDGYQRRGYRETEWLTAEDDRVCLLCDGNEAHGPVRIGEPFPSGAIHPPAHPRCRCAVSMVISSRSEGGE